MCLTCISEGLTDVSLDLLPCRFAFGQALAEALKTNTSLTQIWLFGNSIGDEGVKAFCVPGFQVAAHGVSVVERLCSELMLILRISRFQNVPNLVDCE